MFAEQYWEQLKAIIDRTVTEQKEKIEKAAELLADTIAAGKNVWAFGATHSSIMVQELTYRAGGLATINPLFAPGLAVSARPVTLSSKMERIADYGAVLVREHGISSGDCVLVFSTSGRNAVPVDVALTAKEQGARVIAFVSLTYARSVPSRHPSGKNLADLDLDLVLDNGAPAGDALMTVTSPTDTVEVGPVSTISSCTLVDMIVVETTRLLAAKVDMIPVFRSGNAEGGDMHNERVLQTYKDRIKYM